MTFFETGAICFLRGDFGQDARALILKSLQSICFIHRHNTHVLWKKIHDLSNKNTLTNNNTITFNTKTATTDKQIANSFSKQFRHTTQIGPWTDVCIYYNHITLHSEQLKFKGQ